MSGTPIYRCWDDMNRRCYVKSSRSYRYYGAQGIAVCERWRAEAHGGHPGAFARFLEDMGVRPAGMTLDRVDSRSGYAPDNCRWATPLEQTHNRKPVRRQFDARIIEMHQRGMSTAAIVSALGVNRKTVHKAVRSA